MSPRPARPRHLLGGILAIAMLAVTLAGCGSSSGASDGSGTLPSGGTDGASLVQTKCKMCHSLDRVDGARKDAAEWEETITRMEKSGLVLTAEEKQTIIDYLAGR